jgi:lysophospholipase L1-like esterase
MNCGPFQKMVVLGDSIAYGMCASQPQNEWNQVTARLLRQFQLDDLIVFNRGLPAGVISPRCPGYDESAKPSLMERYQQHCIDLQPDLVIIAEGLNDMRSGMPVQEYLSDLDKIVTDIQTHTRALVVLLGIYHQTYGVGANDPAVYPTWTKWNQDIARVYNLSIGLLAEKHGALFVDTLQIMAGSDSLLHIDACHLNDLGHVLVGNGVFQVIAAHCSGMAVKTYQVIREKNVSILNTGGSDTDESIQGMWADALSRFTKNLD